jgi:hypothetical protein
VTPKTPSYAVVVGHRLLTVLLVVAACTLIFLVVNTAVGAARGGDTLLLGEKLSVDVQVAPEDVPLPARLEHPGWVPAKLEVEDPSARVLVLRYAMDITNVLLFVAVLWLLRNLAGSIRSGDPFGPESVRSLRRIGSLFVAGGLAVEAVNMAIRTSLFNALPAVSREPTVDIGTRGFELPIPYLLAGLGAFILAEVFAHGLRLREDVEGTI